MDVSPLRPQRIHLFGEPVDLVTSAEVMAFTAQRVAAGRTAIVANHNLHSLHLVRREPEMRRFYAGADLIELDSVPMIVWGQMIRKPSRRRHRCTYLDWRREFWALAARQGWRVFYLGGAPGVPERAIARLRERHPGVVVGGRHGYFGAEPGSPDNEAVLAEINAFRPDVLFVGMGMPRQELWIARHYERLQRGVVFPVGAAFDYEAGVQIAAPRWLSRFGLEWAFRLVTSPRRMAERYLVEPWSLIPAAVRDVWEVYGPGRRRSPGAPAQSSP